MKSKTLERAMYALKNGDNAAFDIIYDSTYKLLFFVAYGILHSQQGAEDVVQETYLKALGAISDYQSDNALAWFSTIARRIAINEYNKQKRSEPTDFEGNDALLGYTDSPDNDSIGLIAAAKDMLNDDDFQIVICYAVLGFKRREISEMMNMPVSTVTYRYGESIKKLKKYLKGGGEK